MKSLEDILEIQRDVVVESMNQKLAQLKAYRDVMTTNGLGTFPESHGANDKQIDSGHRIW